MYIEQCFTIFYIIANHTKFLDNDASRFCYSNNLWSICHKDIFHLFSNKNSTLINKKISEDRCICTFHSILGIMEQQYNHNLYIRTLHRNNCYVVHIHLHCHILPFHNNVMDLKGNVRCKFAILQVV